MFGMTTDQIMGLIRQVLPLLGGVAIAFGWLTADQVGALTQKALAIAGPFLMLAGVIWALIANGKASILTSAANMPEVKKIELDPHAPETSALAGSATPSNVRVGS